MKQPFKETKKLFKHQILTDLPIRYAKQIHGMFPSNNPQATEFL